MTASRQAHSNNISGIKLRGASFLMHQVYDDEMTFKLVAAASNVSGLPVEVCLEEFGKHFLVYCQKNGYDQILRVLGSNLYDFLTNLDNLHDHLASIYPGMRAPSFRVTRHINKTTAATTTSNLNNSNRNNNKVGEQQQQVESSLRLINNTVAQATAMSDELHKQNASCSLAGSMYLHYYSERAGLSPIVKGLVMAVAKEFFQTDIVVTECKLNGDNNDSETAMPQTTSDDHVILKIDRKGSIITNDDDDDDDTVHAIKSGGQASELSKKKSVEVGNNKLEATSSDLDNVPQLKISNETGQLSAGSGNNYDDAENIIILSDNSQTHESYPINQQEGALETKSETAISNKPQMIQSKSMLNIYDSLSTNPRDSLVNSEIMMQTFPFNVIFDRQFNLVQVGKSLLRVTSLYWQRREAEQTIDETSGCSSSASSASCSSKQELVKFSDLFRIVRPKIDFTFDAIADHTNQVFVVKTRPLVLNADYRRLKRLSSGSHSTLSSSSNSSQQQQQQQQQKQQQQHQHQRQSISQHSSVQDKSQQAPGKRSMSICPMDRLAMAARCRNSFVEQQSEPAPLDDTLVETKETSGTQQQQSEPKSELSNSPIGQSNSIINCPLSSQNNNDNSNNLSKQQEAANNTPYIADELGDDPVNHISLRLKGQMIILLGGELCLFLCSPRVDHLNQLMDCGVKMSDFALHDRARELMLMSHTHKEDREAVKKLDQASNDLKKMDTKLRQENKRTNEVLHNIFPAKIASLLSHGHKVESESFDLVTCLYSDIIGFTKMCGSENVKPIDIVRLLNTLYLQFDNLTNIHGVFKVETIGDAYVIVGGLPEPVEDHADRCVKMGLDMVKVIATVRSPADSQPIQMRIGIHSGPVMAGIVGIRVPRYSLFGNTTTLANQLETHGVGGKIHISDFTLKNLIKRDRFVVEDNPSEISGIPFVTYFVTNYLGDETETLKHEKILEEQLIKDFELMGNKLELVDDSTYQIQIHASASNSTSSYSGLPISQVPPASARRKSLASSSRDNSSSVDSSATTIAQRSRTTNLPDQLTNEPQIRGTGLGQQSQSNSSEHVICSFLSKPPTFTPTSNRRALGESLANTDEQEHFERLILMDIEDQNNSFMRKQSMELSNTTTGSQPLAASQKQQLLRQLSKHLSNSIISDAIKQVTESSEYNFSLLLAMIVSQQADLELILCKKLPNPTEQSTSGATSTFASSSVQPQSLLDHQTTFKHQPRDQLEEKVQSKGNQGCLNSIPGSGEVGPLKLEKEKAAAARNKHQDFRDDCCLLCDGTGSLKLIDNNNNSDGIRMSSKRVFSDSDNKSICSQDLIRVSLPGALKRSTCGVTSKRTTPGTAMPAEAEAEQENSVNRHSCGDDDYEWAQDQAFKLIYWLLSHKQPSARAKPVSRNCDNGLEYEKNEARRLELSKSDCENKIEKERTVIELRDSLNGGRCSNVGGNNKRIFEADNNSRLGDKSESRFDSTSIDYNDQLFEAITQQRSSKSYITNIGDDRSKERRGNEITENVHAASGLVLSSSIDVEQRKQQLHDEGGGFNQEYNLDDESNVNYFEHKSQKRIPIQPNSKGLSGLRDASQGTEQAIEPGNISANTNIGKNSSNNNDDSNINNISNKGTSFVGTCTQIRDRLLKPLAGKPEDKISGNSSADAGNLLLLCGNCRKTFIPCPNNNSGISNSYTNDVENDHRDAHPSNNENHHHHSQVASVTHKASFDLLQELRFERQKLEEQVGRLRDCEARAASMIAEATAAGSTFSSTHQQASTPTTMTTDAANTTLPSLQSKSKLLIKKLCPNHPPKAAITTNTCGGQHLLSSNIQRMKRMDTLKRRKLKKQELEKDEMGGENSYNKSSDLIDELKRSHCFQLISARQLEETNSHNSGREINSECQSQLHHPTSLLGLEEEDEDEEEGEQNSDDYDRKDSTTCIATLVQADNDLNHSKLTAINEIKSQQQNMKSSNYSKLPEDIQASQKKQINLINESSKIAAVYIPEFDAIESPVKSSFETSVNITPSRVGEQKQKTNQNKDRRTSAYSYQSLKVSLNNFRTDLVAGRQQRQEQTTASEERSKKKFSLNFLSNMLVSISPFSSPVKKSQQMDTSDYLRKSSNDQVVDGEEEQTRNRKHSSRSHSSNSRRSANNNQQGSGGQSGSRGSNCSCLKSSSSQSFDLSLQGTK